jgi:hypothetical protein
VALGILSRDGREGGEGKKAAVNAPQSKRFARDGEVSWSRQRLDCGGFSTAFRDAQQGASALKAPTCPRTPQSEFCIGNGRTGRVPQGETDLSRRNQMKADGNSFPEFILGWTIGAIGV